MDRVTSFESDDFVDDEEDPELYDAIMASLLNQAPNKGSVN